MSQLTPDEIKARFRVVCICKGIKMGRICDAIQKKDLTTVAQVNRATGSGDGPCGATRCRPVIEELIQRKGRPLPLRRSEAEAGGEQDGLDGDDGAL